MLKKEIERRVEIVNRAIKEFLPYRQPEGLYRAARHLIEAGGKRLRPVISILSAEALGKDYTKILPAAVAIETVHNFTLVHDDIMDRDELRRGVPTVHTVYGEATAILAGDTLFAEAFEILSKCDVESRNVVRAVEMLASVCVRICEGQYMDMSFETRNDISEREYLEMVRLKTGVLIAAASAMPAVLFGEDEETISALWDFGLLCGIGFQIHDDLLDITGKDIGKDWGSDLVKGKKTLIVIKAFEKGVELETFGKQRADVDAIRRDVERLIQCGAVDYARKKAREFVDKGKSRLSLLPDSEAKKILLDLAEYLVTREK